VSFPDFPGCTSAGSTLDEARAGAAEALALHVEGMVEDGDAVPEPSSLESIMRDPDNRDGVAILVDLPSAAKVVRVNITIQADVLREIDRNAEDHGFTRSAFRVAAANREITAAKS
jgi:predicted RNase H-like HicB family nuclease